MPLQEPKLTGLKKRQQIDKASRSMFLWVAAAAVAVSVCAVTSQFFIQKMLYNNKVIGVKVKADDTLKRNLTNANQLKQNVDALVGNQDLASVKTNPDDPNTKSVLDALPSVLDTTALATSLQQAILSHSGVSIENITVTPTAGASVSAPTAITAAPDAQPIEQPFSVTVTGSYDKIRSMILDLERTIRPIKLQGINLNGDDAAMRATINAVTYYQPAKTTNIKQEVVK
jgi:Tfp pilus assembly protein PilO